MGVNVWQLYKYVISIKMQKCRIIRSATRGRSVGFFPLEIQVLGSSSYTGRARYVVFPLGTDCAHSILSTSTCVGPNCRCTKQTILNCAAGLPCDRYPPPPPPPVLTQCRSMFTLRVRARLGGLRVCFSVGLLDELVNVTRST